MITFEAEVSYTTTKKIAIRKATLNEAKALLLENLEKIQDGTTTLPIIDEKIEVRKATLKKFEKTTRDYYQNKTNEILIATMQDVLKLSDHNDVILEKTIREPNPISIIEKYLMSKKIDTSELEFTLTKKDICIQAHGYPCIDCEIRVKNTNLYIDLQCIHQTNWLCLLKNIGTI